MLFYVTSASRGGDAIVQIDLGRDGTTEIACDPGRVDELERLARDAICGMMARDNEDRLDVIQVLRETAPETHAALVLTIGQFLKRRSCGSCAYYQPLSRQLDQGECRCRPPRGDGFPDVDSTTWCGHWCRVSLADMARRG